jgi:endonuclease/exonuclease/phosphatase family metal-dependent hydrolase
MRIVTSFLTAAAMLVPAVCYGDPVTSATPMSQSSSSAAAGNAHLKILTWNIWMMPWFTFQSPRNKDRAAAIAAELLKLDFDILCLEKAFDGGARDVLTKELGARYPYRYGPANSSFSLKISSGVWILSRFPLASPHEIQYRDCAGIECFSRKGAIMLTGDFQGRRFQLIATHLQGEEGDSYTPAHQQIRNRQMVQIRDELLVRYRETGVPVFFCGDFGTPRLDTSVPRKETEAYRNMLDTFGAPRNRPDSAITLDDNRSANDLADGNSGRRDELDYILVCPNGAALRTEWTRLILRHRGWDGAKGRQDLSYRYAVGVSIDFQ